MESEKPNYQLIQSIKADEYNLTSVKFHPKEGNFILSASTNGTCKLWDITKATSPITIYNGHSQGINDICWNMVTTTKEFYTASDDKRIGVWDVEQEKAKNYLTEHTNHVFTIKSVPNDENILVSGSFDETIKIWDLRMNKSVRCIPGHSEPISSVDVTIDGKYISSTSYDGLLRIWDLFYGYPLNSINNKDFSIFSNAFFSHNGKMLFVSTLKDKIVLVDVNTGEVRREYYGHKNNKFCIIATLSYVNEINKMTWLVSGSEDHCVYIWDIHRKIKMKKSEINQKSFKIKNCERLEGHEGIIHAVTSHPTMNILGSAGSDNRINIWKSNV